jgi:hypothetical protein
MVRLVGRLHIAWTDSHTNLQAIDGPWVSDYFKLFTSSTWKRRHVINAVRIIKLNSDLGSAIQEMNNYVGGERNHAMIMLPAKSFPDCI